MGSTETRSAINRSTGAQHRVWITGNQPGQISRCPGPQVPPVPLASKHRTYVLLLSRGGAWQGCGADLRPSSGAAPSEPTYWWWTSPDRLGRQTSTRFVATPPEVETTGSSDETSPRFGERKRWRDETGAPDQLYGISNRTLSGNVGGGGGGGWLSSCTRPHGTEARALRLGGGMEAGLRGIERSLDCARDDEGASNSWRNAQELRETTDCPARARGFHS